MKLFQTTKNTPITFEHELVREEELVQIFLVFCSDVFPPQMFYSQQQQK